MICQNGGKLGKWGEEMADPMGPMAQPRQPGSGSALSFPWLVEQLRRVIQDFPDQRTGLNCHYSIEDAASGAFSVFFTQSPSFLAYQKSMQETKGQNNAQSLFGINQIPTDIHIRKLLDEVAPGEILPVFARLFDAWQAAGGLASFASGFLGLLIAMDGTQYFSSKKLHCPSCSTQQHKDGSTTYFHSVVTPVVVTPVVVAPGQNKVIALEPEFILPQDGHDKQDCETAAQDNRILPRRESPVTPAEAGVQFHSLDSGFRRNDETAQTSQDLLADCLPPGR
jgi:hypothetical protein